MFTLGKWLFYLIAMVAFAWFAVAVDLGGRTLYGHVRHLGASKRASESWDSVRRHLDDLAESEAVKKASERARARLHQLTGNNALASASGTTSAKTAPPKKTRVDERLSRDDQQALDHLVQGRSRSKAGAASASASRSSSRSP